MSAAIDHEGLMLQGICRTARNDGLNVVGLEFLALVELQAEKAAKLMLPNTRGHLLAADVIPVLVARIRALDPTFREQAERAAPTTEGEQTDG